MFRPVRDRRLKVSGLGSKNFLSSVFCSFFPFLLSFLLFFLPLSSFPSFPFSVTSFLFSSSSPSSLLPLPPFSSSLLLPLVVLSFACLQQCVGQFCVKSASDITTVTGLRSFQSLDAYPEQLILSNFAFISFKFGNYFRN